MFAHGGRHTLIHGGTVARFFRGTPEADLMLGDRGDDTIQGLGDLLLVGEGNESRFSSTIRCGPREAMRLSRACA